MERILVISAAQGHRVWAIMQPWLETDEKCKAFWSFQPRKDVGFGPLCNLGLEEHYWGTPWTATSYKTNDKRKAFCEFQPRKDRACGPLCNHGLEEHEFSLMDTRGI